MKNLSEELIDEAYKSIKSFIKNHNLSEEEMKELDDYVKSISYTMENIQNKDEKTISNIGKLFEYLIKNGK